MNVLKEGKVVSVQSQEIKVVENVNVNVNVVGWRHCDGVMGDVNVNVNDQCWLNFDRVILIGGWQYEC